MDKKCSTLTFDIVGVSVLRNLDLDAPGQKTRQILAYFDDTIVNECLLLNKIFKIGKICNLTRGRIEHDL